MVKPRGKPRWYLALLRAVVGVVASVVGLLMLAWVGVVVALQFDRIRDEVTHWVEQSLARRGIDVTFHLRVENPLKGRLALTLESVVAEGRRTAPAFSFEAPRVVVVANLLALVRGRIEALSIEAFSPSVRFALPSHANPTSAAPAPPSGRVPRWPMRHIRISGGRIRVDYESSTAQFANVDADARVDGRFLDVGLRATGHVHAVLHERVYDEALCSVAVSVRAAPQAQRIDVRALDILAALDVKPQSSPGRAPPQCDASQDDAQRATLHIAPARVERSARGTFASAHVVAAAPLEWLARLGSVDARGRLALDADVALLPGSHLLTVDGDLQATGIRIGRIAIARSARAHFVFAAGKLVSPRATLDTLAGPVSVTGLELRPFEAGVPMHAAIDAGPLSFDDLLRQLGVSPHPHVRWALERVRVSRLEGTLSPLRLRGDLDTRAGRFLVYDAACDLEPCSRVVGAESAAITAQMIVSDDAFELHNVGAAFPGGGFAGATAILGFHDRLLVDVPHVKLELGEISPLASVALSGVATARVRVEGPYGDPLVYGGIGVRDFVISGHEMGDIGCTQVVYRRRVVDFTGIRARKRRSTYEVPALRLSFADPGQLTVDARAAADAIDLGDLLSLSRLHEGYPLSSLHGSMTGAAADVHFALHDRTDRKGPSVLRVAVTGGLRDVSFFGQRFDEGAIDGDVTARDLHAGIGGVAVNLRALELRNRGGVTAGGSVLATGRLDGGAIQATLAGSNLSLRRLGSPPAAVARLIERADGTVSGIVHAAGSIDDVRLVADLTASSLRLEAGTLGPSSVHVEAAAGRGRALDLFAFGDFLGGDLHLARLVTRGSALACDLTLRDLPLGVIATSLSSRTPSDRPPGPRIDARLSGNLTAEANDIFDLARARVRFHPSFFEAQAGNASIHLFATREEILLADETVVVPPLDFDVRVPNGPPAFASLWGTVASIARKPEVNLSVAVPPLDLSILVGIVPELERAEGTLSMTLSARGPIDAPVLSGAGRVHASRARVRFIGAELTDLELEAAVDARGLSITRASARVGDGTAILSGRMPTTGEDAGIVDLGVAARAVNVTIANGIDGTLDAAAQLRVNGPALLRGAPHSVRIAGDVSVAQLVYRRPIDIGVDLATLASWVGRARRHAAPEAYDPARDLVDLAIRVHARAPFEVKNNVVDARFAPEAAVPSPRTPAGDRITRSADLWLRGTTQRPVLFGRLRALPGGRLRLRGISLNIASATVDFDDASHIAPRVDLVATAEVRRISEFESPFDYASPSQTWRLRVAFAESEDDFRVTLSSEPPLGQDDILLLLTIGLTRAELDTMQAAGGSVQASAGLEAIATLGGAERVVRDFLPIDEFRFGSDYSPRTLRLVPDVSLRKHIGERLSASVTTALTEDRDYRGTLSLQVARGWWIEALWEDVALVPALPVGDLGVGMRWRLDFR